MRGVTANRRGAFSWFVGTAQEYVPFIHSHGMYAYVHRDYRYRRAHAHIHLASVLVRAHKVHPHQADFARVPTLLPSRGQSREQRAMCKKMLATMYRYA